MASIFGSVANPNPTFNGADGVFQFVSLIFKLAGTVAGIFFVFQLIVAGYGYLSASGDEKKTAQAWATIWQSIMGIVIVASAFVIASFIGNLVGIDPTNPTITGP